MSGRKSTFAGKYGGKRLNRRRQLELARRKQSSKDISSGNETRVVESKQPASVFKLEKNEDIIRNIPIQYDGEIPSSKFLLIDVNLLSGLLNCLKCTTCQSNKLCIIEGKSDFGIASELILKCNWCNSVLSSVFSSRRTDEKKNAPFEVTKRMVTAMVDIGVGFAGMEKFCTAMGMKCLHHKTFNKYVKIIKTSTDQIAENSLVYAAKVVRDVYSESLQCSRKDNIIDIVVSYDGSWMKRGHTSNFGVGVAIDLLTGLVLDYQVMSKYCHSCALLTKEFKESEEYIKWKENHICDKNFDGSSESMEMVAARMIWERSIEKHGFRYRTVLSDGDSKTFLHLSNPQVYGDDYPILKEECINHVSKRMGNALRKATTEYRSKGVQLGGRGRGKLTQSTIEKLTIYYQRAIQNNIGDVSAMRNAIYATLFHAVSTDDDPHHNHCPTGEDSWCFYNRAVACGTEPGSHQVMVGTPLLREIGEHLLPIYKRLSEEALLQRCLRGKTQNANESLHSVIWNKCPKTSFLHKTRVETGVALAISQFNRGHSIIGETLINLGIEPGERTVKIAAAKDHKRKLISLKRTAEKEHNIRQSRKLAKLRAEEAYEAKEGGSSYGPGEF